MVDDNLGDHMVEVEQLSTLKEKELYSHSGEDFFREGVCLWGPDECQVLYSNLK